MLEPLRVSKISGIDAKNCLIKISYADKRAYNEKNEHYLVRRKIIKLSFPETSLPSGMCFRIIDTDTLGILT